MRRRRKADKRVYRNTSVEKSEVLASSGELAIVFTDYTGPWPHKSATIFMDRYVIAEVLRAVNKFKRKMQEYHADQARVIKECCEVTGE